MRQYLFIYHDSAEYTARPEASYEKRLYHQERQMPDDATDEEICLTARALEQTRIVENEGSADERIFSRTLDRIYELSRKVRTPWGLDGSYTIDDGEEGWPSYEFTDDELDSAPLLSDEEIAVIARRLIEEASPAKKPPKP
jgi:hypothetical protein